MQSALLVTELVLCRWASRDVLTELNLKEAMVLQPSAVSALASFGKLRRLTCKVQDSLPQTITQLTAVRALNIAWDADMDAGALSLVMPHVLALLCSEGVC